MINHPWPSKIIEQAEQPGDGNIHVASTLDEAARIAVSLAGTGSAQLTPPAFGAYDNEVLERLRWMADDLGPVIVGAIKNMDDGLALMPIIIRAITMDDEFHQRSIAASALLFTKPLPCPRRPVLNTVPPSSATACFT